jgi:hypothetical protein
MPKEIKFNLILDDKPVRNLEDLLDNFNIEDILATYRNGSLKRWLETRKLTEQITALDKIKGDDIEAAMELCRIFHGDYTKQQLETAVYPFDFRQKESEKLRQYKNLKEQKDQVIHAYHNDYEKLLDSMRANGDDYPFIKTALIDVFENYAGLFKMNIDYFYNQFVFDFPLVILGILANHNLRNFVFSADDFTSRRKGHVFADDMENVFLDITDRNRAASSFLKRYRSKIAQPHLKLCSTEEELYDLRSNYEKILILQGAASEASLLILEGNSSNASMKCKPLKNITSIPFTYIARDLYHYPLPVKIFSGQTEGYWKDVEPNDKEFLIIKMEDGNFIRHGGKKGEELKASDINGKFLILNGIDYKSNNANHQLVYMEV